MTRLDILLEEKGYKCHYCGCETNRIQCSPKSATIEHLIDKWSSPKNRKIEDDSNLVIACYECNNTRGAKRNKIARAYYKGIAIKLNKKINV